MSRKLELTIDRNTLIDVNFTCNTPHRMYYKIWSRPATTAKWQLETDGSTADTTPDHVTLGPFPAGAQLAYYLGLWGKKKSKWRAFVTLAQGGKVVKDGLLEEKGTTEGAGFDATQTQMTFA